MEFRDAWNIVTAELTPQPWDHTTPTGATLTVIPDGYPSDPGRAEVKIRIVGGENGAGEAGLTTEELPALITTLQSGTPGTAGENSEVVEIVVGDGEFSLVIHALTRIDGKAATTSTTIRLPEAQRLPLASALARALDIARAWEE